MSDFEVLVQKIYIREHPNADALEIGNIGDPEGWQVVCRKGIYKTGDLVCYIGENSVVPEWVLKKYGFWNEEKDKGLLAGTKGDRVKMVRLRDVPSLGICIPVQFVQRDYFDCLELEGQEVTEGENVADILGVTKYEPPIPVHMAGEVFNAGQDVGVNYDIEDLAKYPHVLIEGEDVQVTVKLHGCVDKESLIMIPNGDQLPIHKIISEEYQYVLSFDVKTQTYTTKKITGTSIRKNVENKKWISIQTKYGNLRLTEDHPVFSRDRNTYIEAKNIQVGEEIESPFG